MYLAVYITVTGALSPCVYLVAVVSSLAVGPTAYRSDTAIEGALACVEVVAVSRPSIPVQVAVCVCVMHRFVHSMWVCLIELANVLVWMFPWVHG